MLMAKKILFPFSVDTPYHEGYFWAVELAIKMKAELLLFTALETKDEQNVQRVFHSLLEAQGHYLKQSPDKDLSHKIKTERCIETGNLTHSLLSFLKKNKVDITVVDTALPVNIQSELSEVIDHSPGAIVLNRNNAEKQQVSFYEKLQHAELYKLPENFYDTLGGDHSLFNYLRKVFRRKE